MADAASGPAKVFDAAPLRQGLALLWRAAPGWTVLQAVLLALQGILPIVALYLTKLIVDGVTAALAGGSRGRVTILVALVGGVTLLGAALRALTTMVSEIQSLRLADQVHDLLHAKSVAIDLQYYENAEYHDTLHRAQEQAPYRPARIVAEIAQIGQGTVGLLAVIGLLLSFHWVLVALLLGAALPGLFIKGVHSRRLYVWMQRQTPTHRLARYLSTLLTSVEFAKEIRLFDLGRELRDRFNALRRRVIIDRLELVTRRAVADFAGQALAVSAVFVSLWFVAGRALAGAITIGAMVMYFAAFQRAQDFFRDLLAGLAGLYEDNLFLADFRRFLDLPPTVVEPAHPRPLARPLGHGIVFDRVSFRYPGTERDVLRQVSFEVRPGEHVALVGDNGSGKTTLVKLLCRLYDPTEGAIRIGGVDLRELDPHELRGAMAVVFQDYARYQLSARDNIRVGNLALAPDSPRIEEAARRTGADAVIRALPAGYETVLGRQFENGADLSLGQWQKLALARAFVRDAEIVVLDEPTAALDPLAEAEVFAQFHELARGRTAIVISHRLSTVRATDRILVMAEGRIAEAGPHDELVGKEGLYARLFETQARPYR